MMGRLGMSEEEGPFNSKPVAEIKLSDTTTIKVSTFVDRRGMTRVDIRTWISTASYTGPTKKGVSFPTSKLDEVISALKSLKSSQ